MIGLSFSCASMALFLGLVATTEISRKIRDFIADVRSGVFEHDTDVFPDYIPD